MGDSKQKGTRICQPSQGNGRTPTSCITILEAYETSDDSQLYGKQTSPGTIESFESKARLKLQQGFFYICCENFKLHPNGIPPLHGQKREIWTLSLLDKPQLAHHRWINCTSAQASGLCQQPPHSPELVCVFVDWLRPTRRIMSLGDRIWTGSKPKSYPQ